MEQKPAKDMIDLINERLNELMAYQATCLTPEDVLKIHDEFLQHGPMLRELHNKHWNECRQIAHYDNEVKALREHIDRLRGIIDGLMGYVGV